MRFWNYLGLVCLFCLVRLSSAAPLDPTAFASLGTLTPNATTTVNTSGTPTLTFGSTTYSGVVVSQGADLPEIAVFTFDSVNIPGGVEVKGTGVRPFAILSKSDFVLGGTINIAAVRDASGAGGSVSGFDGSTGGPGRGTNGVGPREGGSGASFGGVGGSSLLDTPARPVYGDLSIALQGGSAGGVPDPAVFTTRNFDGGGAGGGVEFGALGTITLTASARINAYGASVGLQTAGTPGIGGGSGGGVRFNAARVDLAAGSLIDVHGGNGRHTVYNPSAPIFPSGGGGGGRIYIQQSNLTLGTDYISALNVSGGIGGDFSGAPNPNTAAGNGGAGQTHISVQNLTVPNGYLFNFTVEGLSQLDFKNLIVQSGGIVAKAGPYAVSNDLNINSGGTFSIGGALTNAANARYNMTGGIITAGGGITLSQNAFLRGYGTVSGRFSAPNSAAGTVQVDPGGTLTLGDANSTSGVVLDADFRILTNAGVSSTLVLLDADRAVLGNGSIDQGSVLSAPKGITLLANRTIRADQNSQVSGNFQNLGTVAGPTGTNNFVTFTDNVTGNGSYTGNVMFSDGFSPGNSPAVVSLGTVAFDGTTTLSMELGGVIAGTSYDQLQISGNALLGGATLELLTLSGFTPTSGQSFEILDIAGTRTGFFAGLSEGSLVRSFGATGLFITYAGGDGNDVVLNASVIPEPSTFALIALASVGVIYLRRKTRTIA